MAEAPSVSIAVQRSESTRKNSFLNYESPALTAELQAQFALDLIMRINPETIGVRMPNSDTYSGIVNSRSESSCFHLRRLKSRG